MKKEMSKEAIESVIGKQVKNRKPQPKTADELMESIGMENLLPKVDENSTPSTPMPVATKAKNESRKKKTESKKSSTPVKEKGKRGRKSDPNSAHQIKLRERAEMEKNGIVVKRGRKANPNSVNAQRLARIAEMKANGIEVKRGRKKGTTTKQVKPAPQIRVKLDKTNSIVVKGRTFITELKAQNIKPEAQQNIDYKSTLNHPKYGKMVEYKA